MELRKLGKKNRAKSKKITQLPPSTLTTQIKLEKSAKEQCGHQNEKRNLILKEKKTKTK